MGSPKPADVASTADDAREKQGNNQNLGRKLGTTAAHKSDEKRVLDSLHAAERAGMLIGASSVTRGRSWMTRLANGFSLDLRTNLFIVSGKGSKRKWKPYSEIKAEWDAIYQQAMQGMCPPDEAEFLYKNLEEGNREKMGPKSKFRGYFSDGPDKVKAVMSDKPLPPTLNRRALARAIDRVVAELPARSISSSTIDEALAMERSERDAHEPEAPGLDGTTNSGLPFMLGHWKPHPDMKRDRYLETLRAYEWYRNHAKEADRDLRRGKNVEFWAMVGQRTVSRGLDPLNDPKTKRLIMAMDKRESIVWKTVTPALYAALGEIRPHVSGVLTHMAWKDAPVIDAECQRLLDYADLHDLPIMSADVSAFDASVVPDIMIALARGMASWFTGSTGKMFYQLHESVYKYVRVLAPDGLYGPGPSSVKSGSGGTNFDDSQYNKLALYYGEEIGNYKVHGAAFQGDDGISCGPGLEPEAVSEAYAALGLTLHPDKQLFEKRALSYLQKLHLKGKPGGIGSTYRVLTSTIVAERSKFEAEEWTPWAEAIQAIAKLDNAAFHPAFEHLVRYVCSGDKFSLGADLSPEEVIRRAGPLASDVLSVGARSYSAQVMDRDKSGFAASPTNGVLRGEELPPAGSNTRFVRVYGTERLLRAGLPAA